ncbi:MAG: alpha/beta hydrolase [Solirubrobacteraceae bacterium]
MHVPHDADYEQTLADREAGRAEAATHPKEPVAHVEDVDVDGVPARLYLPEGADLAESVIVHLHGGGFVFNDVEVHDAPSRRLANRTGRAVLSVDYRLAPEHPYPAAVEDTDRALHWAAERSRRVIAHGDSAGGNLAMVGALRNPGLVTALVLIYPFLDPTSSFASYQATDWTWDRDEAQWYWQQYVDRSAHPDALTHPDVAPLGSPDLGTLPPTLIVTAAHDIARDEGEHLLTRLRAEGVRAVGSRILDVPHAFWRQPEHADASDLVMRQTGAFLDGVAELSRRR